MTTRLLDEIQQRKPFAGLEEEALLNLWRTYEVLARASDEFFKAHGITGTQYNVLRILRGAGPGGATCGQIAERMIKADPDITRLLDRMEQRGLIVRARDSKDRRVVLTRISAAGAKLLAGLDKPAADLVRSQLGGLGRKKLQELVSLLEQVRAQQAKRDAPA
jgi:DNA-binding MarR family transcriptional regulator